MAGLPIPSGWDEATDGYKYISARVPNHPVWIALVMGQLDSLAFPEIYDEETGDPNQSAEIGATIHENTIIKDTP